MILVKRAEAVQSTVNKFAHKKFSYGKFDCAHMIAHCLIQLGHPDPISDLKSYKTRLSAVRSMRKAGLTCFEDRLDALFPRTAPASALPGDVVTIQSDDPLLGCLGIRLSGNDILAYADTPAGVRAAIMPFEIADKAWVTA